MAPISSQNSEITTTESEITVDPLASFIAKTGLNMSEFPILRFSVTTAGFFRISTTPRPIVLRVPGFSFGLFESKLRLVRVIETKTESKALQTLDFEWNFSNESQTEDYFHPLFGLLAAEMICPKCRLTFSPQPKIKSPTAAEIQCSHCSHATILDASVGSDIQNENHLFEIYRFDPEQTEKYLTSTEWIESQPRLFPFALERTEKSSTNQFTIVDKFVPETADHLIRGIINHFALNALRPKSLRSNISRQTVTREIVTHTEPQGEPPEKEQPQKQKSKLLGIFGTFFVLSLGLIPLLMNKPQISVSSSPSLPNGVESEQNLKNTIQNFISEQAQKSDTENADSAAPLLRPTPIPTIRNIMNPTKKLSVSKKMGTETQALTARPETPENKASTAPSGVEFELRQARLHSKLKQYPEALRSLNDALKRDPENLEIFPALILTHFELKNYEEASKILTRYLTMKVDPLLRPALESLQTKLKSYLTTARKVSTPSLDVK